MANPKVIFHISTIHKNTEAKENGNVKVNPANKSQSTNCAKQKLIIKLRQTKFSVTLNHQNASALFTVSDSVVHIW